MANREENDKYLVAEQPGLGLSFIGLFLAFFMGLAIRAAVSPDRVQEHLHRATENIHKDLHFSFKKAYVSFSRGLWPDLSVVIEDVKIESSQTCWLTPLAEIHEIRLPLSLRHLFRGQILIHEIFADEVNLSLRTTYQECSKDPVALNSQDSRAPTAAAEAKVPTGDQANSHPAKSEKPVIAQFENVNRQNPIDFVQIDQLHVHYLPIAFTSFHIADFQTSLKSAEPRWIQVTGRLNLEGDTLMGDYSSHADLQLDSIEGPSPTLTATAKGAWREGSYAIAADLKAQTQQLTLTADALHLPLSHIIPLLKKYRWVESEFNGKRAWISGHLQTSGELSKIKQTPIQLDHLKLEGDLGEISSNQARIQSLRPLQFEPIEFQIHGLDIKELLVFLNRPHPSPALGALGIFNGTAHFVNPEKINLRGDYSGLEFIFSNRGNREVQTLSLVSGELELNQHNWSIAVDRIKPVEGIFEGKVKMQADKDFKDLKVDAQITELGLAPKVQTLMTGGGSLGALSGQVQAHLKSAQIQELKGQLRWDQILVEGLRLARPKLQLQSRGEAIQMNFAAQEMELARGSLAGQMFNPIWQQHQGETFLFKNPTATFQTRRFLSFSWDQLKAQSPWGVLQSHGQWNEASQLSGEIRIQDSNRNHRDREVWTIRGTRAQPQFVLREL